MADGPEERYADLTSGQPALLEAAIDSCDTTIRHLADAIDMIVMATDMPEWDSSEAYEAYNLRAWATRAAAEVSLVRVNRASLAMQMAVAGYAATVELATDDIEQWRTTLRSDLSGDEVALNRLITMLNLNTRKWALNGRLAEALDYLQADPFTGDQEQWRTTGLIRSMLHDLNTPNDFGLSIPNTLATGDDDTGWKPQGLGFDPDGNPPTLLQSAYSGENAHLARIDPETGEQLGFVDLAGYGSGPPPDHAGGVVVHGNSVYIMSSGDQPQMYSYSLHDVRTSPPGQSIRPQGAPVDMPAGAWSTIDGNTLYVGTHNREGAGEMFTYRMDDGEWVEDSGPHPIPPETQGAAVIDGQVVFSTSYGRDNTSELVSYRVDDVLDGHGNDEDHRLGEIGLPTMSEGVMAIDGQGLITTYESGALPYSTPEGVDPADMWASQAMTITPFSALGLTGGVEVEPVSLTRASTDFEAGGRCLQSAASSIDGVSLPAGCLGVNTHGDSFASAVTAHCDESAVWIGEGRISANVTADGLVVSAASYVDADQTVRAVFDALNSILDGP